MARVKQAKVSLKSKASSAGLKKRTRSVSGTTKQVGGIRAAKANKYSSDSEIEINLKKPALTPNPKKASSTPSTSSSSKQADEDLLVDHDDMNRVLFMIERGEGSLDICSFMKDKSLSYLFDKKSASDTNIFFQKVLLPKLADKKDSTITLKSWISWNMLSLKDLDKIPKADTDKYRESFSNKITDRRKYAGLAYEARLYEYVTKNIILKGLSNNFIPLIAFGTCALKKIVGDIKASTLSSSDKEQLDKKFGIPGRLFPNLLLNVMVTGSVKRTSLPSLGDLLDTSNIPLYEINSIIFQLLHALYVMEKLEIMQNDLHFGNVLVETLDQPKKITIKVEGKIVTFLTKYIPKIFDWDRGYCPALGPNPIMTNSSRYIQLNSYNKYKKSADYYQTICELMGSDENMHNIETVLKPILPSRNFKAWRSSVTKHVNTDVVFRLNDDQTQKIILYLKGNPNVQTFENYSYIDMPKNEFEKIIPVSETSRKLDRDQFERYKYTDMVYIGYSKNELTIFGGWYCMPYYTVSEKILYPLKTLFTDNDLFSSLTKYLKED
jgi:hypothetical protein